MSAWTLPTLVSGCRQLSPWSDTNLTNCARRDHRLFRYSADAATAGDIASRTGWIAENVDYRDVREPADPVRNSPLSTRLWASLVGGDRTEETVSLVAGASSEEERVPWAGRDAISKSERP
jgi:hypothetical protein